MPTVSPVLIVAGPTGSGKSALGLAIAEAVGGTVINADSMQVYRELRVLTARPSEADEARVPHRLFGVLPATEACSAGRWLRLAQDALDEAARQGRLPVVVGGTGLYLKALTEGLAPVPPIPPDVRAAGEALHAALGGEGLRAALASLDAEAAARLLSSDRQRLVRAWEVVMATGRPLSDWRRDGATRPALDARVIVLMPPRDALYAGIDARFDRMLRKGALEEVAALTALALPPDAPAGKALGVRELAAHLAGEISLAEAAAAAKQATRRFAKRQTTWLRHQLAADLVLAEHFSVSVVPRALSVISDRIDPGCNHH